MLGTPDDMEKAWKVFVLMEATQWNHLPDAGGILDQDDILMENLMRIKSVSNKMPRK
jgi:hypothetical protein